MPQQLVAIFRILILCIFQFGEIADAIAFGVQNPFDMDKSLVFKRISELNVANKEDGVLVRFKFVDLGGCQSSLKLADIDLVRARPDDCGCSRGRTTWCRFIPAPFQMGTEYKIVSKRRAGKSANGSAQSVGRISRRRNPPIAAPEQPSGGLRFANPPYALGQTLPRHFTRRAAASTQKAAMAGVRHRGS